MPTHEPLPVLDVLPQLNEAIQAGNTLILQAPPGAGKSTVLPLELLKHPALAGQKLYMLEPRRLAARAVATRMASLLGEPIGKTVGYRVRFENKTSAETRIEVLTEGILTRMLQQDNTLEGIGMVIFDEFHERSLQADLALALCREAQQVLRDDLRILIMSATLDGEKLSRLLNNAPVITSTGRQYPLTLKYLGFDAQVQLHRQMASAIKKALREHEGDVLCFLPGTAEINRTLQILEDDDLPGIIVMPLYGDLPQAEQQKAIMPDEQGRRKVVLATSIAETSLTIAGITVVIDSGLARTPRFDPRSGLTRLETTKVTTDAADQRAGRAARLGAGTAYRLWNEASNAHLVPHRIPEILEADLAPAVLELAQWGVQDIGKMEWLTPPPAGAYSQAKELLTSLEALAGDGRVTKRGSEMLRLPTHPRIAHLLLEAVDMNSESLACDVAALLEERDPLPEGSGADINERVEVLRKWRKRDYVKAERGVLERIERLATQWRRLLKADIDNTQPLHTNTGRLLAAAYPERIARRKDNTATYRLANGRTARLPQHDALEGEEWLAIAQADAGGNKEGRIFMASALNPEHLLHLAKEVETVAWNQREGVLQARKELRVGDAIIKAIRLDKVSEEQQIVILSQAVRDEGLRILPFNEEILQWQARLGSLHSWRPEEEWPDVSDACLLRTVENWLGPYLPGIKKRDDFNRLQLEHILKAMLPYDRQQEMERLVPAAIPVPSGFPVKLRYFNDGAFPVLEVRLQEMFGLLETPTVNGGRMPVLLHLLSPGYKPVQVTQDLKSFWQNTYPEVRKELRMRYPKHSWPEDPWTAEAVRGVKRKPQQ